MIGRLRVILIAFFLTSCATNSLQPELHSKSEIGDLESISVLLAQPISHLQIDHSSAVKDPALLMQALSSWANNKATAAIQEALPLFDTKENREHVEQIILRNMCKSLDHLCSGESAEAKLRITPIFAGFRFDQLSNVKYLPTYVLGIELEKNGVSIFKHSIGAGNLFKISGVQKTGMRADLGYKKPINIAQSQEEALSRMNEVMEELSKVIIGYITDAQEST